MDEKIFQTIVIAWNNIPHGSHSELFMHLNCWEWQEFMEFSYESKLGKKLITDKRTRNTFQNILIPSKNGAVNEKIHNFTEQIWSSCIQKKLDFFQIRESFEEKYIVRMLNIFTWLFLLKWGPGGSIRDICDCSTMILQN